MDVTKIIELEAAAGRNVCEAIDSLRAAYIEHCNEFRCPGPTWILRSVTELQSIANMLHLNKRYDNDVVVDYTPVPITPVTVKEPTVPPTNL